MARVLLEHVTKRYPNGSEAVKDLNLEIQDGEFLVLVGPSGCGKTTTLRMISGLEDVTEGNLYIGDRLVNDVPPKDRDIAMVFQNYALYPHMSVFDNMAFGLKMRRYPKEEIQRRVREAARMLGIEDLLDRRPAALSGGQRQRVALGRAIVREPQVFLMDEPLSNLDAKLRVLMRAELKKLHERLGVTTVYVTHDQTEAMTLGDRIAVMHRGVLQQVGTPDEVYRNPVNMFVAGFIGSPPMNFLRGVVAWKEDRVVFRHGGKELALPEEVGARQRASETSLPREAYLGIRPQDVRLEGPENLYIEGKVNIVEDAGAEKYVYAELSTGEEFVARLFTDAVPRAEEQISLHPDPQRLHLFDAETELSLFAAPVAVRA